MCCRKALHITSPVFPFFCYRSIPGRQHEILLCPVPREVYGRFPWDGDVECPEPTERGLPLSQHLGAPPSTVSGRKWSAQTETCHGKTYVYSGPDKLDRVVTTAFEMFHYRAD